MCYTDSRNKTGGDKMTKYYRVWFKDGSVVLVDAISEVDARGKTILIRNAKIAKVECLS